MLPTQPTHNVSTTLSSSLQSRTHLVDNKLLDLPVEIEDLPMVRCYIASDAMARLEELRADADGLVAVDGRAKASARPHVEGN